MKFWGLQWNSRVCNENLRFSNEIWSLQYKFGGLQWKFSVSNENLGSPVKSLAVGISNENLGCSNENLVSCLQWKYEGLQWKSKVFKEKCDTCFYIQWLFTQTGFFTDLYPSLCVKKYYFTKNSLNFYLIKGPARTKLEGGVAFDACLGLRRFAVFRPLQPKVFFCLARTLPA